MIAFICATPFQVFNAVNIMIQEFPNDKMDIYALTFRTDLRKFIRSMNGKHIISKVFYIDEKLRNDTKLRVITDYMHVRNKVKKIMPKENNYYTDVFTTVVGGYGTAIYATIKKNNTVKLHFYEEGNAIYINKIFNYYGNIKKFYQFIGDDCEADFLHNIYLYEPNFLSGRSPYPLKKIPAINKNDTKLVKKINHIFHYKEEQFGEMEYTQKIFYLDSYLEPYLFGVYDQTKILEKFDVKDVVVRKHPITKSALYEKKHFFIDPNNHISWEMLLMNLKKCEEKTFITIFSSGVFNPKLIFDEEPRIVILAKAVTKELTGKSHFAEKYWTKELERFVLKLKNRYLQPEKVIIPEDMSEFYKIMENINN